MRGFDIRSIGPSDPETGLVLGGNKSLLFNGEYLFTIANPVRLILFYDAGQVVDDGQPFARREVPHVDRRRGALLHARAERAVPADFRANPQREGVLDNNFRPAKEFVFRFAVGSTF